MAKPTLSPALETAIDYQLKILSVAINYGGHALLRYKVQFKEAIVSAFESTSWKVHGAGDHLLRSLLGSVVLYYPIDQYKPSSWNGIVEEPSHNSFFIAGATGSTVGSIELREKAAKIIHTACRQAWKLESAAFIERPVNFVVSSHSKGKKRQVAGKALLKMIKRWPSMISNSHHESLKAQEAINEIFVEYITHFSGVSRAIFRPSDIHVDGSHFVDLVSQIVSMSFDSNGLHWWYNQMANGVLLLLAMTSRNDPNFSSKILSETAGHLLKNLKGQLPHTRILAISALNTLLKESPYKFPAENQVVFSGELHMNAKSSLEGALNEIFQEDGFFNDTLNSLSHVHIITDTDSTSRGNHGNSSFQSLADKSITCFYFEFSASWPRTPSWISLLGNYTFYWNFA
ncbi:hypothetical protein GH714_021354 [Hevea brasiliensis]|uniref:Proteasome activator Blm10 mid region domain-containing protein n=1 Tax=Hevea brasiliensis TaxID=3981 RepID=A0A6A6NIC8_HEVBR|nr:hypothetical protein GH714_021354 [Hevea brasiliensis]